MIWDAERDEMSSCVPNELADAHKPATKREILRVVASVFDPLGFASPFVLLAKLQLQVLWSSRCLPKNPIGGRRGWRSCPGWVTSGCLDGTAPEKERGCC